MTREPERQTRRERIDPKLKAAGWRIVPFAPGKPPEEYGDSAAVTEFETEAGPADYALWDRNEGLDVVEAKKITLGPQGVLTQSERYSRGFTANPIDYGEGFRVPFLYSTNGEVVWFHDVRDPLNRCRRIAGFHTKAALRELLERDSSAELGLPAATNQAVAALVFDEATEGLRDYLRIFFLKNYERIRQLSFGGVQPNLSFDVIRETPIPLLPLDEQVEIVRCVQQVSQLVNGLLLRIDAAAKRVSRSSEAVLAKAFRGELMDTGLSSERD